MSGSSCGCLWGRYHPCTVNSQAREHHSNIYSFARQGRPMHSLQLQIGSLASDNAREAWGPQFRDLRPQLASSGAVRHRKHLPECAVYSIDNDGGGGL